MNICDLPQLPGDRHLSSAERDQLRACAKQIAQAADVAAAVEKAEGPAIDNVIAGLRERFPRFGQLQPQAWDRLAADLRLVVRHDVRGLLLGDAPLLDDAILLYLRSILTAYRLSPAFIRECFTRLREQVMERLSQDEAGLMEPYLQRNIDVLSDVPEPAQAVA